MDERDDYAEPQSANSNLPTPGLLVLRIAIGILAVATVFAAFWFFGGLKEAWIRT